MKLQIIFKAGLSADVALRWKEQYTDSQGNWKKEYPGRKENYIQLLNSNDLASTIEQIIGNQTWTTFSCDECEKRVEKVINFEKFGSQRQICKTCLQKALELIG